MAPHLLFRASNRRGLGHLMRAANLAEAILALSPAARVGLHLRRAPPPGLVDPRIECRVESFGDGSWEESVREFQPQIIVRDTLPTPEGARASACRQVFVMRRCQEVRQRAIFAHPLLADAELVLVPHTEQEFGLTIPGALRPRVAFVGPIVRVSSAAGRARIAARYALDRRRFVLTSSVGGGGFTELARAFFTAVLAAHEKIRRHRPDLHHIIVRGPYFSEPLVAPTGVTLLESEPDLVDLFALSDLVIAEGGYNTVHELLATRTPAIFLPSPRGADDQADRVARVTGAGLGFFVGVGSPQERAEGIAKAASDDSALAACRKRHAASAFRAGNRQAAAKILELAP